MAVYRPTTAEEREEWKRLEKEATCGKWTVYDGREIVIDGGDDGPIVIAVPVCPQDGPFIAAASNALPRLIADVERLNAEATPFTDQQVAKLLEYQGDIPPEESVDPQDDCAVGSWLGRAAAFTSKIAPRLLNSLQSARAKIVRLEKQVEAGRECAKVMLRLDELEKQAYRDVKPSECGLPVKIDITKFMHGIGGVTFALKNARMSGLIEGVG